MNKKIFKKVLLIIIIILLFIITVYYIQKLFQTAPTQNENPVISTQPVQSQSPVVYINSQYGFSFSLPISWEKYSIIIQGWQGNMVDLQAGKNITGPEIIIRHPLWTSALPRQDIPVMVFTYKQWALIQQEKLAVSAAPIPPSELGRNTKYIFALPARYNFAYQTGFEEVQKIIEDKSFKAFVL